MPIFAPATGQPTPDFYLNGSNNYRETITRVQAQQVTGSTPGTGIAHGNAVVCYAGDVFTNMTFRSGTTPANGPTHWWMALYDTSATPALIAQTADQTTTPIGASTPFTLPLVGGPYTITTTGTYYAVLMTACTTTIPTITCWAFNSNAMALGFAGQKPLSVQGAGSLTTTAPATLSLATATSVYAYILLS